MTLKQQLIDLAEQCWAKTPDDIKKIIMQANIDLSESGIAENIISIGEDFPTVSLPDSTGTLISIKNLLKNWPAVMSFYRGEWCPYCN